MLVIHAFCLKFLEQELTSENECNSESLHFLVGKIEQLRASNHYLTKILEAMLNKRTSKSCKASLMSELANVEGEMWHQNW